VCLEFLEEHLLDDAWRKACIESLESLPPPTGPQALTLTSEVTTLLPGTPINVSNPCPPGSDPEGCSGNQHEISIAVDPDPSKPLSERRVFAIVKTEPFDKLLTARSGGGDRARAGPLRLLATGRLGCGLGSGARSNRGLGPAVRHPRARHARDAIA
jgi:hypothetical protein